jgi:hypothetical protein
MKNNLLKAILFVFVLSSFIKTTAQTQGTLTFSFTPTAHTPANHALAISIGSIRTLVRYCDAPTYNYLPNWASAASCGFQGTTLDATSSPCHIGGAIVGPSLNSYQPINVTWDGLNNYGNLAQDGNLYVFVEETWGIGSTKTAVRYFPFVKGPAVDDQTTGIANDANFTGISLIWLPNAMATAQFSDNPTLKVYPNPSTNGVFNIDFSNQVNSIKVIDMLGKVVYNENIKEDTTDTTKKIDLSSMTNGVYFINATNDKGTSNYKVILDK